MKIIKNQRYLGMAALGVVVFFFLLIFTIQQKPARIPLTITPSGIPAVKVTIEQRSYLLHIDLGSKFLLSLQNNVLESIRDKKTDSMVTWRDGRGKSYQSPSYFIPIVKLGDLILKDVLANQEDAVFISNTTLWKEEGLVKEEVGALGKPLLKKTNLLLDFQNSLMIPCNERGRLEKEGYSLDDMVKLAFTEGKAGLIILADTDAGKLRLGVDTGSTLTLVRSSRLQEQRLVKNKRGFSIFNSYKFSLGEVDFGNKDLILYDITPEIDDMDGVLGMDFLEKHVVYIDYKNKFIYIK